MIEQDRTTPTVAMTFLFDDIDEATAALIIQLQLEDSAAIVAAIDRKGKGIEGELSDIQLALQLYQEDMHRSNTIINDRQMTKSIAQACLTDGNVITVSRSEEQASANDHQMACRLSGHSAAMPHLLSTATAEEINEDLMAKLTALYVEAPTKQRLLAPGNDVEIDGASIDGIVAGNEAESSAWAAARNPEPLYPTCESCREQFGYDDVARVPCGHEYCGECLRELYSHAMTDDTLFPPRCCQQPILPGDVRELLTSELVDQYEKKKIELDTPNRTYCSNPDCSAFIHLKDIVSDQAQCPECDTVTCTMCKLEGHTGDCPEDLALQQALDTANKNGWQRCFNCRGLVELEHGCNHMTFVYLFLL